jgi:hypothetical protein
MIISSLLAGEYVFDVTGNSVLHGVDAMVPLASPADDDELSTHLTQLFVLDTLVACAQAKDMAANKLTKLSKHVALQFLRSRRRNETPEWYNACVDTFEAAKEKKRKQPEPVVVAGGPRQGVGVLQSNQLFAMVSEAARSATNLRLGRI